MLLKIKEHPIRFIFIYIFLIFNVISMNQVHASELTINLSKQKNPGTISLAVYNNAEAFDEQSEAGIFAVIETYLKPQEISQLKIEIPDGEYAISLYIDANENGKLDKNFLGMPKEQFGFSNDAMGKFSPPTFEQAKFLVNGETEQHIQLK